MGVSLRSSSYITEEDLKSFGLAFIDDEDDVSPPPMVLSSSIVVPLRTVAEVVPNVSPAALAPLAAVGFTLAPRGKFAFNHFVLTLCYS